MFPLNQTWCTQIYTPLTPHLSRFFNSPHPCLNLHFLFATFKSLMQIKYSRYRDWPAIETISSFLYHICFVVDYENTFDTTEENDYLVHLESDTDVGESCNQRNGLRAGWYVIIAFGQHFPSSPHSIPGLLQVKPAYHNVSTSGDIRNQLKALVKVGSVDFQQDDSRGNPVLAYLQCRGTPQDLTAPLANGYPLNTPDVSTTFTFG